MGLGLLPVVWTLDLSRGSGTWTLAAISIHDISLSSSSLNVGESVSLTVDESWFHELVRLQLRLAPTKQHNQNHHQRTPPSPSVKHIFILVPQFFEVQP